MNTSNNEHILAVINSLEVIETNGGDEAYVLVENNEENQKALNEVGILTETITKYGDEEMFCILALAFSEGYCDLYDGNKLIKFEKSVEVQTNEDASILLYQYEGERFLALSENSGNVSIVQLNEEQLHKMREVIL